MSFSLYSVVVSNRLKLTDELRKIFTNLSDEDIQTKQILLEEIGVKEAEDLQYLNRQCLANITGLTTTDRIKLLSYIRKEYGQKYQEMEEKNEKDREHKAWHAQVERKKSELEERINKCLENVNDEDQCKNSGSESTGRDWSNLLKGGFDKGVAFLRSQSYTL